MLHSRTKTYLTVAFLGLITAMIVIVLFNGKPMVTDSVQASPLPSLDASARAARGILASVEKPTRTDSRLVVTQALNSANATLADNVFLGSRIAQGQLLFVTVDSRKWASLSDPDRNALFAALASSWAAIWQWNNPHRALQNGAILRVQDQAGRTIREGMYQRQG